MSHSRASTMRFVPAASPGVSVSSADSNATLYCLLLVVWGALFLISWRSYYPVTDAAFFALIAFATLIQPRIIPSLLLVTFFAPLCLEIDRPYVIAFGILITTGLIRYSPASRFANANTNLLSLLLLWLLYLVTAVLNSPAPGTALRLIFLQNVEGVVFVAVLLAFLDTERAASSVAKTIAALGAGAFVIGLVHYLWRDDMWATTQFLRRAHDGGSDASSAFSILYGQIVLGGRILPSSQEPNYWAAQMHLPLWIAFGLAASAREAKARWMWILCSALCLAAILGTYSRGAFLTLLALLAFYCVRARVKSFLPMAVLASATAGMLLTAPLLLDRILGIQAEISRHGGSGRLGLWSQALDLWLESPIFGAGLRGFQERTGLAVHNTYLSVLVDTGVIGLAIYLAVLIMGLTFWGRALTLARARKSPQSIGIAVGGLYGMLGVFVNLLFVSATDPRLPWLPVVLGFAFYRGLARSAAVSADHEAPECTPARLETS
ncbi:MAG: O-antigen ligase family protein [Acidobacteria bacterium]|nr:O-antigen ligase family protein [Acidobacteriota bacterium]